jgi:hypothetical protein
MDRLMPRSGYLSRQGRRQLRIDQKAMHVRLLLVQGDRIGAPHTTAWR